MVRYKIIKERTSTQKNLLFQSTLFLEHHYYYAKQHFDGKMIDFMFPSCSRSHRQKQCPCPIKNDPTQLMNIYFQII